MTEQNQTEQFLHLIKFKDQLITILSNSRTFAIGYHPDADGFASAAILIKYLLSNGVARKNIDLYPANTNERVLEPAQADEVAEKQPDLLIYLDMCGHDPEQIRALKKKVGRIASIDHHRFDSKWPPLFDLYINCKFFAELAHPEEHTTSKLMNTLFHEPQNNWLEIAGLEGDNVVPSLPLTLSHRASSILNQLGEIESGDEDPEIRSGRRNALLDCILLSENLPDFVRRFEEAKKLYELYLKIEADIKDNVENLKKLEPALEFHSSKIFTYEIMAREGYALMNQILKGHLPFLGYNSTYILYQALWPKGVYQIFVYTNNPLVNCYEIATKRTGGGHKNRAGFRMDSQPIKTALEEIIETVKEMIVKGEAEYAS